MAKRRHGPTKSALCPGGGRLHDWRSHHYLGIVLAPSWLSRETIDDQRQEVVVLRGTVEDTLVTGETEGITLLVLEKGAEWPTWALDLRARAKDSAVELQAYEETSLQFHRRVAARLASIAERGVRLEAAGYVCALNSLGRMRARREACDLLLSSIAPGPTAELVVAGGSWESVGQAGDERFRLIELWGALSETSPGPLVSVRFEDPPSESGVFYAADKLNAPFARVD